MCVCVCVCVYACVEMYYKWHAAPQMWILILNPSLPRSSSSGTLLLISPGQFQLQVFAHILPHLQWPLFSFGPNQTMWYIFIVMPSPCQNHSYLTSLNSCGTMYLTLNQILLAWRLSMDNTEFYSDLCSHQAY